MVAAKMTIVTDPVKRQIDFLLYQRVMHLLMLGTAIVAVTDPVQTRKQKLTHWHTRLRTLELVL